VRRVTVAAQMSDTTSPTTPTTISTSPTMSQLTFFVLRVTAKRRIAPTAMRMIEVPIPMNTGYPAGCEINRAGLVKNVVHWAYGSSWGAVYALIEESVGRPLVSGVVLTSAVMAADYTMLPAMKIYKPPWDYEAETLTKDFAKHLVRGLAIAAAYRGLDAAFARR